MAHLEISFTALSPFPPLLLSTNEISVGNKIAAQFIDMVAVSA